MRFRICLAALAIGAGVPPLIAQDVPKVEFEKFTLGNGLQVILHTDRKLPMVNVNIWYHVGSKNERVGRSGFAHLFEHMMFEGSKNANQKYFAYAARAGANLYEGGVNGTTNWDRTNYFVTVPPANLENVLWLESDRMATLADALSKERLDNQREVVRNERRQSYENQPYGRWRKLVMENLFPHRHPYAGDVIGTHEDLQAATLEDVKNFFRQYYGPNNASLAIVGDFDVLRAKEIVEKYFANIPPGPALDRPAKWLPAFQGPKVIEVRDRAPQERTYFAWVTPAFFDPGDGELELVAMMLTGGVSARLYKTLVHDKRLCSNVNTSQLSLEQAGTFVLWATARPGVSLSEVERVISDEIGRLAHDGPSAEELTQAKTKWESQYVGGLESIGGYGGKADWLNRYNLFLGSPAGFGADLKRHLSPTPDGVRAVVARWLDTPNRLTVRFRPEQSRRAVQVALDRSKEPPLSAGPPFRPPTVAEAKLDNGLDVLVVERSGLPMVAVTFLTRSGSIDDTPRGAGLASLTATMLPMGTATRNALEIEEALGGLGASLRPFAERALSGAGLQVLKRNLAPAVAILSDVVRNSSFPASEFDLEKKRRLDALSQEEHDPYGLRLRLAPMLAFGASHPYGTPDNGLPQTVRNLTREDLERFHRTYWKPGSSALVFAGDVTLGEAMALARQEFGSWNAGARPVAAIPPPQPAGAGKVFLVDRQDAAQTMIVHMLPAPPRRSDEYYALALANAVWGSVLGGRLNDNLREQKGYSYGVMSFLQLYSAVGVWQAYGTVQTDKTRESLVEFVKELSDIAGGKPVTAEELGKAKANLIRGYAQQFELMERMSRQRIGYFWSRGMPLSEMQREPDELEKTTLEQVNTVARKYAQPRNSTLLLVGDLAKIEAGVREVVNGDVVVLDAEGRQVKK